MPTVWAILLTVPVVHQQVGWEWLDPDTDAKQVISEIESLAIRYVAGDYWGAYLADYLADGRLQAAVDVSVRLDDEQAVVNAADPPRSRTSTRIVSPAPADAGRPVRDAEPRTLRPLCAGRVVSGRLRALPAAGPGTGHACQLWNHGHGGGHV